MSLYSINLTPQARNFRGHHSGRKYDLLNLEASDLEDFTTKVVLYLLIKGLRNRSSPHRTLASYQKHCCGWKKLGWPSRFDGCALYGKCYWDKFSFSRGGRKVGRSCLNYMEWWVLRFRVGYEQSRRSHIFSSMVERAISPNFICWRRV
jgi:hypothetical protein